MTALLTALLAGVMAGCELEPILRKVPRAEKEKKEEQQQLLPPAEEGIPEDEGRGTGREVPPELLFDSLPRAERKSLPGALMGFQQVFADVAEKAIPAVVSISSERNVGLGDPGPYADFLDNGPFRHFFGPPDGGQDGPGRRRKETGLGSGVIISTAGYVLTNNHVIEGADAIVVKLHDETEYQAEIVGTDKPTDMAVIKVKA
jgi:S1-C subfamily serine protease